MPLLPHFGTYNLQQQKASKFKFLLQQKFGFLPKYLVSTLAGFASYSAHYYY